MSKSVYSLVLTDEVVAEIDRAAYGMNTSRSNLINQLLAEYVSYTTPEKRMREVFGALERLASDGGTFQVLLQPSDAMFSLRSALAYKYNPNIRYSVELYRGGPYLGELRVSLRSQNSTLTLCLLQFFKLWAHVETRCIGPNEYSAEQGRYARKLRPPPGCTDSEAVGRAIADYIDLFDTALKAYFERLNDPAAAAARVDALYVRYLRANGAQL